MKKPSVNLAIAAYNAEQNIERLVTSLSEQQALSYKLKHIIVNSDSSSDRTVEIARSIKNSHIVVRDQNLRQGFAGVVIDLLKRNDADIIILLNDDIIITDNMFVEKTVKPFVNEKGVGLVCSNPMPFKGGNLMQRAITSSFNAYEAIRTLRKNGNTVLTCDGKTLTFSKQFIKSIRFPKDLSEMANVDWFLFFTCIKNGFKYRFVESAKVYYKNPTTIKDYIKWTTRNNVDVYMMKKRFGAIFDDNYQIPRWPFLYHKAVEFVKNPIGCLMLFSLSIYCIYKAKFNDSKFEIMWDLVATTKNLA